jgi:hypothetical protein
MRSGVCCSVSVGSVQDRVAGLLQDQVGITDVGHKCGATVLISVWMFAASRVGSIFDACRRLRRAPSDQAVRQALGAMLSGPAEWQRRLNAALTRRLPKSLFRKPRPLAIDLTEIPYHGKPWQDPRELCRSKPNSGTTHFHT